uniref:uncharacterized protein LOC122608743 n=1 Tax=Erigeron canadensis TaxID=72917 RepID=UPI001CB8A460|nr:uncharacterized protein LOC122608743 [Erigeron canadensis]
MKFQMLALFFFFILLCSQFTSNLALESKAEKDIIDMNGGSHSRKEGLKQEELVVSKATGGRGSSGGQNNRPSDTKKNKATSMLIRSSPSNIIIIGAVFLSMILVLNF